MLHFALKMPVFEFYLIADGSVFKSSIRYNLRVRPIVHILGRVDVLQIADLYRVSIYIHVAIAIDGNNHVIPCIDGREKIASRPFIRHAAGNPDH